MCGFFRKTFADFSACADFSAAKKSFRMRMLRILADCTRDLRDYRASCHAGDHPKMSTETDSDRLPPWLDRESVKPMKVVEQITSLNAMSLRRHYGHYVVKLTPRRDGMKLKHALAIANGTADRA
jgi:hypothetical protein